MFLDLSASTAVSVLWMAIILPGGDWRASLVLLKASQHIQLCAITLLGSGPLQIFPDPSGVYLPDFV